MKVVDMILAQRVPGNGQCLLNEDLMKRAYKMGENIMTAIKTPPEERKWLGEEDMGWCPNCHSNALVLGEVQWDGLYYPVECQVCGAGGTLEQTDDGKWKFVKPRTAFSRTARRSKDARSICRRSARPRADSLRIRISRNWSRSGNRST